MNCPGCGKPVDSAEIKMIIKHISECTGWPIDKIKQRLYNIGIITMEEMHGNVIGK